MVLGAFATREILLLPLDIYRTLINGVPQMKTIKTWLK